MPFDSTLLPPTTATGVRTVRGEIRRCLAKIYGNVSVNQVFLDGCSRTDRGVHATAMLALMGCIEEEDGHSLALNRLSQHTSSSSSSGETESGNQTLASTATLIRLRPLPQTPDKMLFTLNRMLPQDVRIVSIAPVPVPIIPKEGVSLNCTQLSSTIHRASLQKTYRYVFSTGPWADPLTRHFVWHLDHHDYDPFQYQIPYNNTWTSFLSPPRSLLRLDDMLETARILTGTHDFASFQGAPRGKNEKRSIDTVCTLHSISLTEIPTTTQTIVHPHPHPHPQHRTYELLVTGDRFLYKMMRFLTGCIVAVGFGQLTVRDVQTMLDTGARNAVPQQWTCAPARGLTLVNVTGAQYWMLGTHDDSNSRNRIQWL